MHPLRRYLADVNEPVRAFAARVGTSRQTLYRIFSGAHAPKPALARRIVEASGGSVSFDALYQSPEAPDDGAVVTIPRKSNDALDAGRLMLAIAIVFNHVTASEADGPSKSSFVLAAEAVIETYSALSKVTTRRGADRLRQALRPVLEELLNEHMGKAPSSVELEKAVDLATQLYLHAFEPERRGAVRSRRRTAREG